MKLAIVLRDAGYEGEAEGFRDLVIDLFQATYPSWTDEVLLHNPTEACRFCDAIRLRAKVRLTDELILRCLTNARKKTSGPRASA